MNTQHKNSRCLNNLPPAPVAAGREASLHTGSISISISVVLVITIVLAYAYLAQLNSFLLNLPSVICACALIVISVCTFGWAAPQCLDQPAKKVEFSTYVLSGTLIMLVAVSARLLFIARMPELSDDIFRYLWDGFQVRMGHNPYSHPPAAMHVEQGYMDMAQIHPRINHPGLVTIYPPVAQLIFALGSWNVVWMKGMFVLFDMGNCVMLLLLLQRLQRHPAWLCLYAWHPLAVLESSASGHVDVAALFFILLAIYFALRPESYSSGPLAGAALGLAIMTKIFPLIFAPLLFIQLPAGRRGAFILGLALVCAGTCIPFWPELQNGIETLRLYAHNWEFSSFAFRVLRTWTGSGSEARMLVALIFCLIFAWQWLQLYQLKQHGHDAHSFVRVCARIMLAFLLLTPTLHPWYAIYLLALLPLAPGAAGIILSWSVLLSYQVAATRALSGIWQESTLLSFYIFAAPVSALCITLLLARRRNKR